MSFFHYLPDVSDSAIREFRAAATGIFKKKVSSHMTALSWIPFVSQASWNVEKILILIFVVESMQSTQNLFSPRRLVHSTTMSQVVK